MEQKFECDNIKGFITDNSTFASVSWNDTGEYWSCWKLMDANALEEAIKTLQGLRNTVLTNARGNRPYIEYFY